MTQRDELPDPNGQVSDAYSGNWVDHYAPVWTRPYLRLSRADRPIGTWLLLLPCWWGLLLASGQTGRFGLYDLWIAIGCALGAWLMRGAGCTWNDITDRNFDGQVERTKSRPIPAGQVSVRGAVIWMGLQALISLGILLTFNAAAILMGFVAIIPVLIYPFAKRFTWWPQVFLGIAFNWGALLAWVAHTGRLEWPAVALYLAGISWTLFYDTIYAHQDKEDDAMIGVKSTARLFGARTRQWLLFFMILTLVMLSMAIIQAMGARNVIAMTVALAGAWVMGWHLAWQLRMLDIDNPDMCLRLFRASRDTGLIPVLFLAVSLLL